MFSFSWPAFFLLTQSAHSLFHIFATTIDLTAACACIITECMFRGKTNFFERRVGEYQKSSVMAKLKNGDVHEFKTDCDF